MKKIFLIFSFFYLPFCYSCVEVDKEKGTYTVDENLSVPHLRGGKNENTSSTRSF